jgi:hypothetical protein
MSVDENDCCKNVNKCNFKKSQVEKWSKFMADKDDSWITSN